MGHNKTERSRSRSRLLSNAIGIRLHYPRIWCGTLWPIPARMEGGFQHPWLPFPLRRPAGRRHYPAGIGRSQFLAEI